MMKIKQIIKVVFTMDRLLKRDLLRGLGWNLRGSFVLNHKTSSIINNTQSYNIQIIQDDSLQQMTKQFIFLSLC